MKSKTDEKLPVHTCAWHMVKGAHGQDCKVVRFGQRHLPMKAVVRLPYLPASDCIPHMGKHDDSIYVCRPSLGLPLLTLLRGTTELLPLDEMPLLKGRFGCRSNTVGCMGNSRRKAHIGSTVRGRCSRQVVDVATTMRGIDVPAACDATGRHGVERCSHQRCLGH